MPFLPIGRLNENFLNRQKLMELFTMPQVKEALYVASPVLYDEMCKAMEDSYGIPQKDINHFHVILQPISLIYF